MLFPLSHGGLIGFAALVFALFRLLFRCAGCALLRKTLLDALAAEMFYQGNRDSVAGAYW